MFDSEPLYALTRSTFAPGARTGAAHLADVSPDARIGAGLTAQPTR